MADNTGNNKKIEQNDPNGAILKSVKSNLLCGGMHQFSILRSTIIVDSHMHIQSGHCATLPFIWKSAPGPLAEANKIFEVSRGFVEKSGSRFGWFLELLLLPLTLPLRVLLKQKAIQKPPLANLTDMQAKPSLEISDQFMKQRKRTLEEFFKTDWLYTGLSNLALTSVVMTMDMEYAHIDGYYGLKIYNAIFETREKMDQQEPVAYWTPMHGIWVQHEPVYGISPEPYWVKGETGRGEDQYRIITNDNDTGYYLPKTVDEYAELAKKSKESIKSKKTFWIKGACLDDKTLKIKHIEVAAAPVLTSKDETKKYERWEKQLQYTELAVLKNPLKLLPMFHYDPRRWQLEGNTYPMSQISGQGLYLGFKMYTAQGYQPWDTTRLPVMEDFYAKCCKGRIPIMNHCTPDGAASVERDEYINFRHANDPKDRALPKGYGEDYFKENFVSPNAWKNVLDKEIEFDDESSCIRETVYLNELHLCLAHFGGPTPKGMEWNQQIIDMITETLPNAPKVYMYPNLYTDISSSFADSGFRKDFKKIMQGPHADRLKERILFGTDWYMTFVYHPPFIGKDFMQYCRETKNFLDDFDTSLWTNFVQHNPYRFYRLNQQIDRIATNIIKRRQADEKVQETLQKLKPDEIKEIKKEAAYIKAPYECYEIYWETPCKA